MSLLPSREARHPDGPCGNARPFGILAFGIAGATGTSSLGVTAFGIFHAASAYQLSGGVLLALIATNAVTALVSSIALILKYKINKMTIEARIKEAQGVADLQEARQEMHRIVIEKAACEPASASAYLELIIADAVHLSVEQGSPAPADRTNVLLQPVPGDCWPLWATPIRCRTSRQAHSPGVRAASALWPLGLSAPGRYQITVSRYATGAKFQERIARGSGHSESHRLVPPG